MIKKKERKLKKFVKSKILSETQNTKKRALKKNLSAAQSKEKAIKEDRKSFDLKNSELMQQINRLKKRESEIKILLYNLGNVPTESSLQDLNEDVENSIETFTDFERNFDSPLDSSHNGKNKNSPSEQNGSQNCFYS